MLKYSSGTLYTMSVFIREEPELGGAEITFWGEQCVKNPLSLSSLKFCGDSLRFSTLYLYTYQ